MSLLQKLLPVLALVPMALGAETRLIDYVNPMVGTKSMGHTFPGACAPFGLVQLSPDTEMVPHNIDGKYQKATYRYCAGYQYDDPTIVGFSHTHLNGTGHSDLGDILIMPTTGKVQLTNGTAEKPETGYRSRFRHDTEKAEPGYYTVMLDDYKIKAELTATKRVGVHRYTFPENTAEGHLILDLVHGIYNYDGKVLMANLRVEDAYTLTGYRLTRGWSRMNHVYFAVKFSKPILKYGCQDFDRPKYTGWWRKFNMKENFPEMFGTKLVAYFDFDFSDGQPLEVQVGLSAVDSLGALRNIEAETGGKNFDQVKVAAQAAWEKELRVAEVTADDNRKAVFYTALYRTMINPSVYQDVDGRYRGIDHNIHQAEDGSVNYTVFSVWDTYRAEHPLLNLLKPQSYSKDIVNAMLNHYRQSPHGALPVWAHMGNENWCMIGYHAVSVVADAVVKGIGIDPKLALEACVSSANVDYYDATDAYKKYGYVPVQRSGVSASITMEYAYDDWAVSALARKLGDAPVAKEFFRRAASYRNVFDESIGFARPKNIDGTFREPFDLLDTHNQGFIEGNSWNYSFYVPQDVAGMMQLMGGEEKFVARLDELFTMHLPEKYYADNEDITDEGLMGNYVHGNEPSHHVAYLYAWTDQPWKGEYRLHEIMRRMYRNAPDGLCGNDDCGQMSAWYVFSSLGFYPVCPGSDQYALGSPNAQKTVLNLENGKTFTINAPELSDKNVYVQAVRLNGKPYHKAYLTHQDILRGGEITFEMGDQPNKTRRLEKPYSMSTAAK